jgi:zinc transport system ATP-binding protein
VWDASLIELSNVGVQYPNGVWAVEHISLRISKNDLVGFIGPNGAGKTTLIGVILGLIRPTSGAVTLFGESISTKNLRRVGYVPQVLESTAHGFPATVFETVMFGRVPHAGLLRPFTKNDVGKTEEALKLLEISELRNRKLGQLSGGQLQRVLVAKALATEPEILILDEPTSGADIHSRTEFYTLLADLNRDRGIAIVLSSHDVDSVTKLASKVVCINRTLFYYGPRSGFTNGILAKTYGYPMKVIDDSHT